MKTLVGMWKTQWPHRDCDEHKRKLPAPPRSTSRKMNARERERRHEDALGDRRDARREVGHGGPSFEERDRAFYDRAPRQNPPIRSRSRR